jgi:hypothetical protein
MIRTRTAALAACVAAVSLTAFAQVHTVTRVGLVAKPRVYNGSCPATIDFIGTIRVSRHPARVEYEWERSDGGRGRREVVEIRSAGQSGTPRSACGSTSWHPPASRRRKCACA